MSNPLICADSPNVIGLPALESGPTPCDSLGGLTIAQFGQVLAPANLSHRQAKALGLEMSGISGRRGTRSSSSAALQSSLESRLRARTASAGSILFTLTWKVRVTPSGLSISALRASGRRTSVSVSGLSAWPTPRAEDAESSGARLSRGTFDTLTAAASLAGWGTPTGDEAGGTPEQFLARKEALQGACGVSLTALNLQAQLAGWPTPTTQDAESAARHGYMTTGNQGTTMLDAARLANWATPNARDEKVGSMKTYRERGGGAKGESLSNQAASLCGSQPTTAEPATGPSPTGSTAETRSTGQLSPEHSRYLMGLPHVWDACAVTAMQSLRPLRRPSSKARG